MVKKSIILLALTSLLLTFSVSAAEDQADEPNPDAPLAPEVEPNLLSNPSFEGQYSSWIPPGGHPDCPLGECTTAQMASGWTPWWIKDRQTDVNPEYKPAELWHTDPDRVRSGSRAQQYFSFHTTHEAGVFQNVPVQNGASYCFSVWGHSWSAKDDDNAYSGPDHGWLDQKVGIDPSGGTNPSSASISWSPPRLQYDEYGYFSIGATASSNSLTVFTHSKPIWSTKHNDVYWDDAKLIAVPDDVELGVTPSGGLNFLAGFSSPKILTKTVTVDLPEDSCITWVAEVESAGALTPTISLNQGHPGDQVAVTINSANMAPGTATATIKFTAIPSVTGSPLIVPIKLTVKNDLLPTYLPTIIGW